MSLGQRSISFQGPWDCTLVHFDNIVSKFESQVQWYLSFQKLIKYDYLIEILVELGPEYGGFHLHLLVFPFVYQFNSRIGGLDHSSFANDYSSEGFQQHFSIVSRFVCCCFYMKKNVCSFFTHLFCCIEMRWLFISSTAIWVTGSDTGSVASRARTKLTSSKCDWTRIWAI